MATDKEKEIDVEGALAQIDKDIESASTAEEREALYKAKIDLMNYRSIQSSGGSQAELEDSVAALNSSMEGARKTGAKISQELSSIIEPIINTTLASQDVALSKGQIEDAEREVEALDKVKPSYSGRYKRSELLKQQIADATRDLSPTVAEEVTQGLKADIEDQFAQDVQHARTASGGQSGSYAALGQVAANRRLRNALALQDAKRQLRNDARSRLDRLSQAQAQEEANVDRSNMMRERLSMDQWNREAEAAGAALAQGRQNLRTSRGALAQGLYDFVNPTNVDAATGFIRNYNVDASGTNPAIDNKVAMVDFNASDPALGISEFEDSMHSPYRTDFVDESRQNYPTLNRF